MTGGNLGCQPDFLLQNPEVATAIENKVRENAGLVASAMLEGPDDDGEAGEGAEASSEQMMEG